MGMQTSLPSSGYKKKSASASIAKVDIKSEVTAKDFLAEIFAAAGPTDSTGAATVNPNPHWSNSAQQWSHEFAPRMAAAIAKAVNLGTSRISSSVGDSVQSNLSSFETQLKDKLNAVEALESAMARIHQSSRMRLDLLWWSQARYSSSQHSGYSSLNESVAAFVAAVDLSKLVLLVRPAGNTPSNTPRKHSELDGNSWDDRARYVELLQILLCTARKSSYSRIDYPRLAIVLSCWDETGCLKCPSELFTEKMPLLNSFIRSNWLDEAWSVWGLSSLGKALSQEQCDQEYAEKGPENFGYVVEPHTTKMDPDLTRPVAWLMKV
jgi:hypothetical protein